MLEEVNSLKIEGIDLDALLDDICEEFADDPYYSKSPKAQMKRVTDYIDMTERSCNLVLTQGSPRRKFGRLVYIKQSNLKLAHVWKYMNLDRDYKKKLLVGLSELVIGGNKVTLFFPKNGEKFDIGIRW